MACLSKSIAARHLNPARSMPSVKPPQPANRSMNVLERTSREGFFELPLEGRDSRGTLESPLGLGSARQLNAFGEALCYARNDVAARTGLAANPCPAEARLG